MKLYSATKKFKTKKFLKIFENIENFGQKLPYDQKNYPDILRETETVTAVKRCNRVEISRQLEDS